MAGMSCVSRFDTLVSFVLGGQNCQNSSANPEPASKLGVVLLGY